MPAGEEENAYANYYRDGWRAHPKCLLCPLARTLSLPRTRPPAAEEQAKKNFLAMQHG
jgi:hypothetical protein